MHKVCFNVLAKDLENAKEISSLDPKRILVGVMVKGLSVQDASMRVLELKAEGVLTSLGLGAGDPAQWKKVADVATRALPFHINQVYPAAGYTLGRLQETHSGDFLVNSLIEPSDQAGKVYLSTGESSRTTKEKISCELAAKLHRDIGLRSIKFYPIEGSQKLEHVRAMVRAAVQEGITIFEPTGGIDVNNVHAIVKVCLEEGARHVIPHLYTSLIDKQTGKTRTADIQKLLEMSWDS